MLSVLFGISSEALTEAQQCWSIQWAPAMAAVSSGFVGNVTSTCEHCQGCKGQHCRAEVCLLPLFLHVCHGSYSALFIACYSHLALIREVLISSWAFLWYSSFRDECFTNANWSSAGPLGDSMVGILPLHMRSWDSDWVKKKEKAAHFCLPNVLCHWPGLLWTFRCWPSCSCDTWGSQCPGMRWAAPGGNSVQTLRLIFRNSEQQLQSVCSGTRGAALAMRKSFLSLLPAPASSS